MAILPCYSRGAEQTRNTHALQDVIAEASIERETSGGLAMG